MASRMKAMNPPISGQNMARTLYEGAAGGDPAGPSAPAGSGVQRDLLVGRGERPGDLQAPLLAEDEAQLARGTQAVRMRRAEGGAGPGVGHRAQKILTKEAVLAARLRDGRPTIRHTCPRPRSLKLNRKQAGIKADSTPSRKVHSRKSRAFSHSGKPPKMRGLCVDAARHRPQFP